MADFKRSSGFAVIFGGLVVFLILCVGAYFVFGPGAEKGSTAAAPGSYPGDPLVGQPVKTPSGLVYYDLREGTGPRPPGPSSTVRVHYTGWLLDGSKFDSSVDRGEPAVFPLNKVIKGWTEGVGSMKVGGKRKLIVPAALGYGQQAQQKIPAGSTLVFDVELLEIVN